MFETDVKDEMAATGETLKMILQVLQPQLSFLLSQPHKDVILSL